MIDAFAKAIDDLDEEAFQLLYGRWDPLEPERVADLLSHGSIGLAPLGSQQRNPLALLPGTALTEGCEQLWARRNAQQPWQLDLLLDRSRGEWEFKRDARAHVPWQRALHT
jgi:hypothetical protein